MSEAGNKADARSAESGPEPSAFGKAAGTGRDLDSTIRRFAADLGRDFADDLAHDPAGFCRRVLGLVKSGLRTRGPGRPGLPEVTAAIGMREQGKPWSEIYPACIPHYASLDPTIRRWHQRELRDRVRSRRYQQQKRKDFGRA